MADQHPTTANDIEQREPALLADAPPTEAEIADGAMFPSSEVRRLVAAAEERGYGRAWAEARRHYKRARDALIERVAKETAAILRGEKGKEA